MALTATQSARYATLVNRDQLNDAEKSEYENLRALMNASGSSGVNETAQKVAAAKSKAVTDINAYFSAGDTGDKEAIAAAKEKALASKAAYDSAETPNTKPTVAEAKAETPTPKAETKVATPTVEEKKDTTQTETPKTETPAPKAEAVTETAQKVAEAKTQTETPKTETVNETAQKVAEAKTEPGVAKVAATNPETPTTQTETQSGKSTDSNMSSGGVKPYSVSGDVQWRTPGGTWQTVSSGITIPKGAEIKTGNTGSMIIFYPELGTRALVNSNTNMIIGGSPDISQKQAYDLYMSPGTAQEPNDGGGSSGSVRGLKASTNLAEKASRVAKLRKKTT